MLKKMFLLALSLALIIGCSQKSDEATEAATEVTVAQAIQQADQYVDKAVKLEGTVVHVCTHGGKRMFITGENPDERLKITIGADIGAFDVSLEGSVVEVEGVMKEQRIDAAYIDQREADIASDEKSEKGEIEHIGEEHSHEHDSESHSHEHADHDHDSGSHKHEHEVHKHDSDSHEHEHKDDEGDSSEDDHHSKDAELKQLQALKQKLADSGKDYLSFYSVECTKFTEKK